MLLFNETVKQAVDAEIDRIKNEFSTVSPDRGVNPKYLYVDTDKTEAERAGDAVRLRLDWEIDISLSKTEEELVDWLFDQIRYDLYELLTYGDTSDIHNPVNGVLDGAVVRKTNLKSLTIDEMVGYHARVERKGTVEYTVFFLLHPEWV